MADKLMYLPKLYPCSLQLVDKTLDIQLNEPANQNSLKLISQRIGKNYNKTLGTFVKNSPMSPPFLKIPERKGKI